MEEDDIGGSDVGVADFALFPIDRLPPSSGWMIFVNPRQGNADAEEDTSSLPRKQEEVVHLQIISTSPGGCYTLRRSSSSSSSIWINGRLSFCFSSGVRRRSPCWHRTRAWKVANAPPDAQPTSKRQFNTCVFFVSWLTRTPNTASWGKRERSCRGRAEGESRGGWLMTSYVSVRVPPGSRDLLSVIPPRLPL